MSRSPGDPMPLPAVRSRRATFGLAVLAGTVFASRVLAHHGEDPASELPLWLMVAVAAAVAAGWLGLRRLRGRTRRADAFGEPPPAP